MTKLYVSRDLETQSSGGIVTRQELLALESLGYKVIRLGCQEINPILYNLPDNPFLQDYLTMNIISQLDLDNTDLAHFYSTPYPNTIMYLKAKNVKTTITCAAHDRRESIKEFQNLGYQYIFCHISDERLWKIFSGDIRYADMVITPSKSSETFLKNEGCKNIVVIPHGVDIPDESKIRQFPNEFRCGYAGAIGPDKGLIYLIRAWELLHYSDSRLIFAGHQSENLEPLINNLHPQAKYHLAGFVPNIADFYNNVSIYIQPSVVEGWGIETIEAMSYGRPVIVSNGAGSADAVTDGVDGFIVEKRNPEAIAQKIDWFKNHPDKIIEFGKKAREKAKGYDWQIIKEKYINVWKSLI